MGTVALGKATALMCLMALLGACGGETPSPTPRSRVTGPPPTIATTTPAPTGEPGPGGTTGSATVELGGLRYELTRSSSCLLSIGVQADLSSADGRASLSVFMSGSVVGLFLFARLLDGERWVPSGSPAPFQVSGSSATWSGPMRESNSGREEQAAISINCGG